jgi:hypothetical protein
MGWVLAYDSPTRFVRVKVPNSIAISEYDRRLKKIKLQGNPED